MKKKIVIWGTKLKALRLLKYLDMNKVDVIAITDKTCTREQEFFGDIRCISKYELVQLDFDYIVIASKAYCEITGWLMAFGIRKGKIVQAFNASHMIPNTLYFFNEIDSDDEKIKLFTNLDCLVWDAL